MRIGVVAQLMKVLPHLDPNYMENALQILDELSLILEGMSLKYLKDYSQTIPKLVKILMVFEACAHYALSLIWVFYMLCRRNVLRLLSTLVWRPTNKAFTC